MVTFNFEILIREIIYVHICIQNIKYSSTAEWASNENWMRNCEREHTAKWITVWNRITHKNEKNMSEIKDILSTGEFSPFFIQKVFFEFWNIKYAQKWRIKYTEDHRFRILDKLPIHMFCIFRYYLLNYWISCFQTRIISIFHRMNKSCWWQLLFLLSFNYPFRHVSWSDRD